MTRLARWRAHRPSQVHVNARTDEMLSIYVMLGRKAVRRSTLCPTQRLASAEMKTSARRLGRHWLHDIGGEGMGAFDTRYHTTSIEGLEVFYREAGDPANPTLVLLHGFPSSSHMFRNLIGSLADRFHMIAPDHIGFGRSAMPSVDEFSYSFD